MNLPNRLTLSRIFLTFIFILFLFLNFTGSKYLALAIFILACGTDYLDGRIARKRQQVTDFGKLLDPLADKILILAAFLAFVELGIVAGWMVVLVVARELTITGIRIFVLSSNRILPSSRGGKHKTASQMVAIFSILSYLALRETQFWGISQFVNKHQSFWETAISILMLTTVVFTLISGFAFFWHNRSLFANDRID